MDKHTNYIQSEWIGQHLSKLGPVRNQAGTNRIQRVIHAGKYLQAPVEQHCRCWFYSQYLNLTFSRQLHDDVVLTTSWRAATMQTSKPVLCPSCAMEFAPDADVCLRCGKELKSLRAGTKYQLVHDGDKFGVVLRGRMVFGKMELKEAQSTLAIINGTKPEIPPSKA
jgi:hypothetical protein